MDPFTIIAIIQAGLAIYRLVSSGGNEASKLQALQIEMLRAISEQLSSVSKGITQTLDKLDSLETLIGNLPEKLVLEDYHAQILGAQNRFFQLANSYDQARRAEGIEIAQEQYAQAFLDEVIWPIHQAVTDLTSYTSSLAAIPMVSIAMWVQLRASIIANVEPARVLPQLENYERWLANSTSEANESSVLNVLKKTKIAANDQLVSIGKIPTNLECFSDFQVRFAFANQVAVGFIKHTITTEIPIEQLEGQLATALEDYRSATGDRMELSQAELRVYSNITTKDSPVLARGDAEQLSNQAANSMCPAQVLEDLSESVVKKKINDFNLLNIQCLILGSWRVAAETSLRDCREKIAAYSSL